MKMLKLIHINLADSYLFFIISHKYFLIIINDYSWYVWVWFFKVKDKKTVFKAIHEYKNLVENQFNIKIKWAYTDNETDEFINNE